MNEQIAKMSANGIASTLFSHVCPCLFAWIRHNMSLPIINNLSLCCTNFTLLSTVVNLQNYWCIDFFY